MWLPGETLVAFDSRHSIIHFRRNALGYDDSIMSGGIGMGWCGVYLLISDRDLPL